MKNLLTADLISTAPPAGRRRGCSSAVAVASALAVGFSSQAAAVTFGSLDGFLASTNFDFGGSQNVSGNSFVLDDILLTASEFSVQAAFAVGNTDGVTTDVSRFNVDIRIYEGPLELAQGDPAIYQSAAFNFLENVVDRNGSLFTTTTTSDGITVDVDPSISLGTPDERINSASDFVQGNVFLSQRINEEIAAVLSTRQLGEELSISLTDRTGSGTLLTAVDQSLGGNFAFRTSTSGNVLEDLGSSVALVAVPEPTTAAFVGIGALTILRRRRG